MSRFEILLLATVCCFFGTLAVAGPNSYRHAAWALNAGLAVALVFITGKDLRERGWRQGYLWALTFVLPLIGLVVYAILSGRDRPVTPA